MLTKDLLRFHLRSGSIKPLFIQTDDRQTENIASALLDLYQNSIGEPRSMIADESMPLVNAQRDRKLAAGLRKVIEDSCRFSGRTEQDYPAMRQALFAESSRRMKEGKLPVRAEEFRKGLFAGQVPWKGLEENLYPDLPDHEKLVSVPAWDGKSLMEMYNCVLAQSLILYASALTVTAEEPDPARMRRFFKYVRFFQLLATVEKCDWKQGIPAAVRIRIDGPASILEHSNRYGLSLASFLPALFQLQKWKFSASLDLRGGITFSLDQKSGLQRKYGRFSAYIPEEIRIFADFFARQETRWKITQETPFLRMGKTQDFLFPDVTFSDGVHTVYMELFHRWHSSRLVDRIRYLEENPEMPLLIGADRTIPKSDRERIESHPEYRKRLFLFRDFPGAGNVEKLLDRIAGRNQ